ncbi:MAG: DCC1-like thiol-disulfide oxidoreductase family protein [Pseudomonadota bacterium]
MNSQSLKPPLTVFHDASCPICRAEMEELVRIDDEGKLELVDCSTDGFVDVRCEDAGLTQTELMSALYIVDRDDQWRSGPDAFAEIYGVLGMDRMARVWGRGWWRPLVNLGYRLFALTRGWLAPLGIDRAVRWWVRKEAEAAATRSSACRTD